MKKEWIFKFSLFIFLLVINLILLFLNLPNLNAILTIGVIITSITLFSLARKFEFYSLDLYLSYAFNVIAICLNALTVPNSIYCCPLKVLIRHKLGLIPENGISPLCLISSYAHKVYLVISAVTWFSANYQQSFLLLRKNKLPLR